MLLAFVHVSEFKVYIRLCTFLFTAMLKLEQAASLHQGKDAPSSGATKGTMPSCPLRFFKIFQKLSDNFVETNRTSERFFDGNSNSRKVKMTTCMGRRVAIRSKFLVLMHPQLQHEDLQVLI
jgi:hypothetical protein